MSIPNEPLTLPMLYKIDSKGITRCWRTWTVLNDDGTATEMNESGIEGGKMSGIPIIVTAGKNIGKKNETTPLQQANKRIQSKFDKKLREGYVADLNEFVQRGVMKAHEWRVSKHRMSQIALHQPKIDGIRCVVEKDAGDFRMMSKSNKEFKPYLRELPWANYLGHILQDGQSVDGEMYIHGVELNDIASLVMSYKYNTGEMHGFCEDTEDGLKISLKTKEILDQVYVGRFSPEEDDFETAIEIKSGRKTTGWIFPDYTVRDVQTIGTSELQFWAFDIPQEEVMAEQRNEDLRALLDNDECREHGIIALVAEEFDIDYIEEVNEVHLENGFEGTMIRKPSGMYAFGDRTADLQKFKLFFDAEWVITGYTLDRQGNPNFTFESAMGDEFESRPKGTQSWRARILSDMDNIVGKTATIRYQKLFADTLVPQFGRVIAIRDYE